MEFQETKRAGEMPPDGHYPTLPTLGQENPPPYSAIPQTQPTAPTGVMGPPPPTGYPQPNVATTFIPVMVPQQMGPNPASVVCQYCNKQMTTRVEMKTATKTHLFALLLCVIGCWPCACIPYCMDSCMNTEHYCSNCNAYIGSYSSN